MMVRPASKLDLRLAAVFCGILGLYDIYQVFTFHSVAPFPDWLVFHAAVQAYFEGKQALIYSIDGITQYQNQIYADRLSSFMFFRPFFYPPIWLLMLLPFGLMGVVKAYGAFMVGTAAVATAVEGRRDWWGWLAIVTSPAAMWVVVAGQNTFLSMALLYGGIRLIERSPAPAGLLLGLLSYKPQIWVLVPLALIAAQQWRALAWTLSTVALLSLVSLGVFGLDLWMAFFDAAREGASSRIANLMLERVHVILTTFFAAAHIVGLPPAVGGAIQLAGATLATVAVWIAFSRSPSSDARTAVLVTATFLVSPYSINYDLLLLMPVVVALFRVGAMQGFLPGEQLVYAMMWLMPTSGLVLNDIGLPIIPLVILLFGAIAVARLYTATKAELPSTAMGR